MNILECQRFLIEMLHNHYDDILAIFSHKKTACRKDRRNFWFDLNCLTRHYSNQRIFGQIRFNPLFIFVQVGFAVPFAVIRKRLKKRRDTKITLCIS
nr:MAG TPA: NADH-QUINONE OXIDOREDUCTASE SUBUNIT 1 [Caudoviricetes sp.]